VIRRIREWSQVPIIVLSVRDGEDNKVGALDAGADDYLIKPFTPEDLILAIEGRLRRLALGAETTREAPTLARELKDRLTERELEVLVQIGRGLVTKDIAERLALSPRTVSVHRANIMRKLDLHNAAALAALAIRAGI